MSHAQRLSYTWHKWGILLLLLLLLTIYSAAQDTPGLYALPDANARLTMSSSIASASDGRLLLTANLLNNTVSLIEPLQSRVQVELAVGADPRTVAVTPDSSRAVVVNRGDGTLSLIDLAAAVVSATYPVGVLPYGVVTFDNAQALVALQGTDEIVRIDLNTGAITARIPTADAPAGLALWGDLLYVSHLWSGQLSLIYMPQLKVISTVSAGNDAAVSQSILIDAQRGLAYLPQTRLNAQNGALTFDTTVFPVVNVFDLSDLSAGRRAQLTLDTADRPVNLPFAAVLDSQRRWLYVANAGSDNISVIDLTTGLAVANLPTGLNPRGLLLSRDNGTLYIHNAIEGTVTSIDTRTFRISDELPVSELTINSDVYLGAQFFNSAIDPRLTADQWISCASCHFDGQSDGRVWQGYPGGARNTPLLYALGERALLNADGSWDELADVELKIRALQGGAGFIPDELVNAALGDPHAGLSPDLDTLTAYLLTLDGPAAPPPADPALAARGFEVFTAQNCASCHAGERGTDGMRYDVGTGGDYVTPTLRWLWLSAPYLHDGSAPTLLDLFLMPGDHQLIRAVPLADVEALVAYLETLPVAP
ncbi:MAG: hypothetical protein H7Y11_09255 [Armatimonadetes bacterium]|nr:hypothetical protein [Anaerolineae bacterium]